MAYKLFLDTNVFLDVLLERIADWKYAEEIMELAAENMIDIYTSPNNLVNVLYSLERQKAGKEEIIISLELILSYTNLIDISKQSFKNALRAGFTDLEDAIQYHTALAVKDMDYFITSNTKDYKKALPQLPVITPKQFIAIINKRK
jgi:predicted nucleic acid-binding protein